MFDIETEYRYLGHETIDADVDRVHCTTVLINGPVALASGDYLRREEVVAEVFVPNRDCRSESPDDLLRAAIRRLAQLSEETHGSVQQVMWYDRHPPQRK